MSDNIKLYSEMERFEIINVNDGEKYNYLGNNDVLFDSNGFLKLLIINESKSKFSLFSGNNFLEIPWDCVKKIGARTVIIDVDDEDIKKNHI